MAEDVQRFTCELRTALGKGQFEKAIDYCSKLIERKAASDCVIKAKCVCLIKLDKWAQAYDFAAPHAFLLFEQAYCLYRLNRLEEAYAISSSARGTSDAMRHLMAQIQYRLGAYDQSAKIYAELMDQGDGNDNELKVNTYAAFTSAGMAVHVLEDYPVDESELADDNDLRFNVATALIAKEDYATGKAHLEEAIDSTKRANADKDTVLVEAMNAPLKLQLAYTQIRTALREEALHTHTEMLRAHTGAKLELEVSAVFANNLAVLRGDRDLPDSLRRLRFSISQNAESKLTKMQLMTIRYNRCILQAHLNKFDECIRTLDELRGKCGPSARDSLIRASVYALTGRWSECEQIVQGGLQECESGGQQEDIDELLLFKAHSHVMRCEWNEACSTLKQVRGAQNTPACVSAMYLLQQQNYNESGQFNSQGPEQVLMEALEQCKEAEGDPSVLITHIARVYTSVGMHMQAAKAYAQLLGISTLDADTRMKLVAEYAIALSHFDSNSADIQASYLPQVDVDAGLDVQVLENAELPRARSVHATGAAHDADLAQKKRGPTDEQRKKRKAKRREKYLAKLTAEGSYDPKRPTVADPERWISKKQRSYSKRGRKNKGKFTGAQGSGEGALKDTAKLDVAARTAEMKTKDEEAAAAAAASAIPHRSKGQPRRKGRR